MRFAGFYKEDEAVEWAKEHIGVQNAKGFCRAMSVINTSGEFEIVVVMSNFTNRNVDMHIAARNGKMRLSPKEAIRLFNGLFEYVFSHNVVRVTGLIKSKNAACQRLVTHLGFAFEGCMRKAFADDDLHIYGFLSEDYIKHSWRR